MQRRSSASRLLQIIVHTRAIQDDYTFLFFRRQCKPAHAVHLLCCNTLRRADGQASISSASTTAHRQYHAVNPGDKMCICPDLNEERSKCIASTFPLAPESCIECLTVLSWAAQQSCDGSQDYQTQTNNTLCPTVSLPDQYRKSIGP